MKRYTWVSYIIVFTFWALMWYWHSENQVTCTPSQDTQQLSAQLSWYAMSIEMLVSESCWLPLSVIADKCDNYMADNRNEYCEMLDNCR
jgi:hypothetical protein